MRAPERLGRWSNERRTNSELFIKREAKSTEEREGHCRKGDWERTADLLPDKGRLTSRWWWFGAVVLQRVGFASTGLAFSDNLSSPPSITRALFIYNLSHFPLRFLVLFSPGMTPC